MHMIVCICVCEFRDEIILRGGKCEAPEKFEFLKKGKMIISVKIQNFSRSRTMMRDIPLSSSREI